VLGQAHTPLRRPIALGLMGLAILAIPAVGGANPSQDAQSLRTLDRQLEAKQRAAVLDVYSLDQQLSRAQARLTSLRAQAAGLRAQERRLRYEQGLATRDSHLAQQHLAARLRTLYDDGTLNPVEILLGAQSLDQALNEIDTLSSASGQDEAVLRELSAARAELGHATRGLAQRQAALTAATRAAATTESSLAAARAARQATIASLADKRRLTEAQVATVVAQAHAAALKSQRIEATTYRAVSTPTAPAPSASAAATQTPAPTEPVSAPTIVPAGGRALTVVATGYALSGRTATGLPVGWGVAAVDPSVIPLGTHFTVPGYGEAVAADTGGAVGGDTIDLWFPTAEQADAWGRRTVTIVLH
jgi:cystine transport system substrate-binding protein